MAKRFVAVAKGFPVRLAAAAWRIFTLVGRWICHTSSVQLRDLGASVVKGNYYCMCARSSEWKKPQNTQITIDKICAICVFCGQKVD
jgi:hypothetical protein